MPEILTFPTQAQAVTTASAWIRLIGPPAAPNPALAADVLKSLQRFPLVVPELYLTRDRVDIGFIAPPRQASLLAAALRGVAPAWEIELTDAPPRTGQECLVAWLDRSSRAEGAPLRTIDSYKDSDPLAQLVEAAQPDRPGEQVKLRFLLRPARKLVRQRTWEAITVPPPQPAPMALLQQILPGAVAVPRVPRFEARQQRPLTDRLHACAFEVIPLLALTGPDRGRLTQRARHLDRVLQTLLSAGWGGLRIQAWGWGATPITFPRQWPEGCFGAFMLPEELALLLHPCSNLVQAPGVSLLKRPSHPLPLQLHGARGLLLAQHRYRGQDQPVCLLHADLQAGPLLIVGRTGGGKTVLGHQLARQLMATRSRPSVCFLDPHRDAVQAIAQQSLPPERLAETFYFDCSDLAYPISLPLFIAEGVDEETQVQTTFALLRQIFRESWSASRMEDTIFALTATVTALKGTLLDVPRLLHDPLFRRRATARVTDPVALQFWTDFNQLSESARREVARPILYRLRSLYRAPAMRNLLCQRVPGPNWTELLDAGSILLFGLSGSSLDADLLGELIFSKLIQALLARLERPADTRRPTYILVDESQKLASAALGIAVREARKTGLGLVLSVQHLSSWPDAIADAVLSNFAGLVAFRCGPDDARRLAASLKPFGPEVLENLDRHEVICRIQREGITLPPIDGRTVALTAEPDEAVLAVIRDQTRERFARPRDQVEAEINDELQQDASPPPTAGAASSWERVDIDED